MLTSASYQEGTGGTGGEATCIIIINLGTIWEVNGSVTSVTLPLVPTEKEAECSLDTGEEKSSYPCQELNHDFPVVQPTAL